MHAALNVKALIVKAPVKNEPGAVRTKDYQPRKALCCVPGARGLTVRAPGYVLRALEMRVARVRNILRVRTALGY